MDYIHYFYNLFFKADEEDDSNIISYISDSIYKSYYDYNDMYITYYEED
jgi:hypothetical protein